MFTLPYIIAARTAGIDSNEEITSLLPYVWPSWRFIRVTLSSSNCLNVHNHVYTLDTCNRTKTVSACHRRHSLKRVFLHRSIAATSKCEYKLLTNEISACSDIKINALARSSSHFGTQETSFIPRCIQNITTFPSKDNLPTLHYPLCGTKCHTCAKEAYCRCWLQSNWLLYLQSVNWLTRMLTIKVSMPNRRSPDLVHFDPWQLYLRRFIRQT